MAKAVYLPSEGNTEVPAKVKKIFKAMGIGNPEGIEMATIH